MNTYQISQYFKFRKDSADKHGVHSPYVYHLITDILKSDKSYYSFEQLNAERKKLHNNSTIINVTDLGAGSKRIKGNKRRISSIAKTSVSNKNKSELLFRLVNYLQPQNIVELGTSLGLQTAYFSKASHKSNILTFEGCPMISDFAKTLLNKLNCNHVKIIQGNMDDTLQKEVMQLESVDFAFIDGNHRYEPTMEYCSILMDKINSNTVWVLDDIHWSKEMTAAWNELISNPEVSVSIDLFDIGIVFFDQSFSKENFRLRF